MLLYHYIIILYLLSLCSYSKPSLVPDPLSNWSFWVQFPPKQCYPFSPSSCSPTPVLLPCSLRSAFLSIINLLKNTTQRRRRRAWATTRDPQHRRAALCIMHELGLCLRLSLGRVPGCSCLHPADPWVMRFGGAVKVVGNLRLSACLSLCLPPSLSASSA